MKTTLYLCAGVGGVIGAYIPSLLGGKGGMFSFWGLLGSLIGGLAGIWIGYKLYSG
ncbi:MAG: hypothetical protein U0451_04190 [Candidatus Saccharimonadales bacterium]